MEVKNMLSEEKLKEEVIKSQNGDSQAMENLYNEFYDDVFFICLKIIGNYHDAQDITQETFLQAFQAVYNLNDPISFKSWISKIAANKSINHSKHIGKMIITEEEKLDEIIDEINGNDFLFEVSPEERAIENDVRETLLSIIEKLPDEQKTTVFLFYYENMTIKEISEIFCCSENTVKSRLLYARKFIRKEVEKLEDKGYKLRCISALPFIFSLFRWQRKNIITLENSPVSSVSSGEKGNLAKKIIGKVRNMPKKTKAAIAVIAAATVIGGTGAGAVLSGCNNNSNNSGNDTSIVSYSSNSSNSASNENSEKTDKNEESKKTEEISEEVSKEESKNEAFINWKFRSVTQPKLADPEYTQTQPYKESDIKIITATPPYKINADEVKEKLKKNKLYSDLDFAEYDTEGRTYQTFSNVGTQIKFVYRNEFLAFPKGLEETDYPVIPNDKRCSIAFSHLLLPGQFNGDSTYQLTIYSTSGSQEEVYSAAKDAFGDEMAEYLVYGEFSSDESSKSESDESKKLDHEVKLYCPNKTSYYIIQRHVKYDESKENFYIRFYLNFNDQLVTGSYTNKNKYEYYKNNYQPMKLALNLDDMLSCDLGSTDLDSPDNFIYKALDFGGDYDKYVRTTFADGSAGEVQLSHMTYSNGTVYCNYEIKGGRIVEEQYNDDDFGGYIDIEVKGYKKPTGKFDMGYFLFSAATTDIIVPFESGIETSEDETKAAKATFRSIIEQYKIQASYLFGIKADRYKDAKETIEDYKMIVGVNDVKLKVFGEEISVPVKLKIERLGGYSPAYRAYVVTEYINNDYYQY